MAYRIRYSDYSTGAEGPPDPAAWIGPPGPMGPMGPTGPQGPQGVAGNPFPEAPTDGRLYGRGGATVAWSPVLPLTGGTMGGPIVLPGNATLPLHAVPLQQLSSSIAAAPFLPTAGGAMGGVLTLAADPVGVLEAATRQYVDAGVATAGNGRFLPLATGGNVAGGTTFSAAGTALSVTNTLDANTIQNFAHKSQTGGTFNTALGIYGALSGTRTGGNTQFARIDIQSDTMAASSGLTYLSVEATAGGVGITGNRVGEYINFNFSGGTTNKGLGIGNLYGAHWAYATASGNVGGVAGIGNSWGSLWGGISNASLISGATFWTAAIGHEVDVGVKTGASASRVQGLKIALANHDQAPQYGSDYLLGMAGLANTNWSPLGISFGSFDGVWPFDPGATLIGMQASGASVVGIRPYTAAIGIDLSGVTFSTAFLKSTGFQVDGSGNTTAASFIVGASGPTITSGSGVPASTQPKGSLYTRTTGAVGSTLYVSQGGGTWNAVAGV